MKYKSRYRGFTLLELIIALAIASLIILTIFSASLSFYRSQKLRDIAMRLNLSFKAAHILAISQQKYIMILPIEQSWQKGWITFEDINHNAALDNNETIVEKFTNNTKGIFASKNTLSCITFNPMGLTNRCTYGVNGLSGMLSNGTVSFNLGNDTACKNTLNVILNRANARICTTSKNQNGICECSAKDK